MNIFRIAGDMAHLASFVFLLQRLLEKRSAAGISLKTLELYLLVFVTRYLDIFHNLFSLLVDYHGIIAYNSVMKIIYIAVTAYVVYLLRKVDPWRASYRAEAANDSFLHWKMAVLPCVALAIFFNEGNWTHWRGVIHYVMEVAWAFSIYLEAVAYAPQLILLQRHGHVENITSYYVACLGAYRALYIMNWIYRWATEPHYSQWIAWVAGLVQTLFYADFMYYFYRSKRAGLDVVVLPQ